MLDKPFAIFNEGQGLAIIRGNSVRPLKGPEPGTKWPMLTPTAIARNIQRVRKRSRKESFFRCRGAQTRPGVTVADISTPHSTAL
jgi:hypothetical protein